MIRKIATVLLLIACLTGGVLFFLWKKADVYHTAERRAWKNAAVVAIANDLRDPEYLQKRFGEVPKPRSFYDTSESGWLTPDTIICRDATWLAYRAQTHKVDPKIHDIFIAKTSDGRWYYSDFHFCVEMYDLRSYGQPKSLEAFKKQYFLVQFDGSSNDALKRTWNGEFPTPTDEE